MALSFRSLFPSQEEKRFFCLFLPVGKLKSLRRGVQMVKYSALLEDLCLSYGNLHLLSLLLPSFDLKHSHPDQTQENTFKIHFLLLFSLCCDFFCVSHSSLCMESQAGTLILMPTSVIRSCISECASSI